MINKKTIEQVVAIILISILLIFTYFMIKPIFMAMIFGLVLAYVFNPLDKWMLKYLKNKTITSMITCLVFFAILFLSIWFLIPILTTQIFDAYVALKSWDLIGFLNKTLPFLFGDKTPANFVTAYNNFISNSVKLLMQRLTDIIVDFPSLLLKSLVALIVFFYALRDGDKIMKLLRDSLPFEKAITERFILKSKQITFSVVFGRVVTGIITGLLTGLGFWIAGVKSTVLLTFIAILAAIIPIVGPWIVWIPVVIGLYIVDKKIAATLLLIYGALFISFVDNLLHAVIVSKKTKIPTSLTLIGIIGGMLVFGIFGIILGPLLIAYLATLFEIYREHNTKR